MISIPLLHLHCSSRLIRSIALVVAGKVISHDSGAILCLIER